MANKRIIDLTATTTPSGYVALDHETNGTKKLDVTKISPVDSTLSSSSTNAVQNKVINTALSGKLATNGNSQNNTVAFTSGDVANDAAATSWTANVATLATGLTHANLFNRISTMMKNVRYLYNAVTKLNTDLAWNLPSQISSLSALTAYFDSLVTTGVRSGYLSASQSTAVGISSDGAGHYWQYLTHNQNFAEVVFYKNTGDKVCTLKKMNGTWDDHFLAMPTRAEVDSISAITNCIGKIIGSGSIESIAKTGIYYLGDNVTDKPSGTGTGTGGLYVLVYNSSTVAVGLFARIDKNSTTNILWRVSLTAAGFTYTLIV